LQKRPELRSFWEQLAAGWEYFEWERRLPRIAVNPDGTYRCDANRD
jgi:hypothetical protein